MFVKWSPAALIFPLHCQMNKMELNFPNPAPILPSQWLTSLVIGSHMLGLEFLAA
jgi:hypothetical protein